MSKRNNSSKTLNKSYNDYFNNEKVEESDKIEANPLAQSMNISFKSKGLWFTDTIAEKKLLKEEKRNKGIRTSLLNISNDSVFKETLRKSSLKNDLENFNKVEYLKVRSKKMISDEEFDMLISQIKGEDNLEGLKGIIFNNKKRLNLLDGVSVGGIGGLKYLIEKAYSFDSSQSSQMIKKFQKYDAIFSFFRPIKGDGNCFYRAVIFKHIENVLLTKDEKTLRNLIAEMSSIFSEPQFLLRLQVKFNLKLVPELTLKIMFIIYESLCQGKIEEAYYVFVKSVVSCAVFDYSLVLAYRFMLYEYIKDNEGKLFTEDFPVLVGNLLPAAFERNDKFLFNEFYESFLLKMFTEAEKLVIYLTPFVLGVKLNIILFELDNGEVEVFDFDGKNNKNNNDTESDIWVMNKREHYEILYNKEYINKYKDILKPCLNDTYQSRIIDKNPQLTPGQLVAPEAGCKENEHHSENTVEEIVRNLVNKDNNGQEIIYKDLNESEVKSVIWDKTTVKEGIGCEKKYKTQIIKRREKELRDTTVEENNNLEEDKINKQITAPSKESDENMGPDNLSDKEITENKDDLSKTITDIKPNVDNNNSDEGHQDDLMRFSLSKGYLDLNEAISKFNRENSKENDA